MTPVTTVRVAAVMAARVNVGVFGVAAAVCFVAMMMFLFLFDQETLRQGSKIRRRHKEEDCTYVRIYKNVARCPGLAPPARLSPVY